MSKPRPTPHESYDSPAHAFERLYAIVRKLRGPEGCPWDREQSPQSLRTNLIEEAYECVSAIEEADDANLEEELGDLYLLVTMIAYMKQQEGCFQVLDALDHICAKLVRRHPHVFGDAVKGTSDEVVEQWNHIKDQLEGKRTKDSVLEKVPRTLPPLERALEIQKKVSKVGFDWGDHEPVWDKLQEEIAELREAGTSGDAGRTEQELGDLLFTVVNLGRLMKVDPTLALNSTNQKFVARFQELERRLRAQGLRPEQAGLEAMDQIWNQIKAEARTTRPASGGAGAGAHDA